MEITELKATVFDIVRRQSAFQQEIQNLEKLKEQKLKELSVAEQQAAKTEQGKTLPTVE